MSSAGFDIIDSHIHLWPKHMSNEQGHTWMTPGMPLAKEHLLSNYYEANNSSSKALNVKGVIYVETDVRYEEANVTKDMKFGELFKWAKGPLDEIEFLADIVHGKYGQRDSDMLLGIVAWAPMHQPPWVLEEWPDAIYDTGGEKTWLRIKGFRFLLQAIRDQEEFEKLVFSEDFIQNLKILGEKGFTFDVGVDQRSGGIWQLEAMAKTMAAAHRGVPEEEKVVFVLNHLCKPDFGDRGEGFERWCAAIEDMARLSRTYMKLSGAFSELPEGLCSTEEIVAHIEPWVKHVFRLFGPRRVMFGSDWPVCNLRGPRGEESWISWVDIVQTIIARSKSDFAAGDEERIWGGTAMEVYKIAS